MAMILRDYKCPAHGFFESSEAVCPHGCTTVDQVWLSPPSFKSDRTKASDKQLKQLALEFKMSDIKSTKEGEAQKQAAQPQQNPFAVQWGSPSQLGNYNLQSIRGEHVSGIQALKQNAELTGPRTASYIADHQNLTIDK